MSLILRRRSIWVCSSLALISIAALWFAGTRGGRRRAYAEEIGLTGEETESQEAEATTVKVVRPKFQKTFSRTVSGPAYVEAFFKADLFAHVAGPVKFIEKNIGDRVVEDELLVEIDVPDVVKELSQKEALVKQAEAAEEAAEAAVVTLRAQERIGHTAIEEKEAQLDRDKALRDFRKSQAIRFKSLSTQGTVAPETAEEKLQEYQVSEASCKSAEVGVKKARLDLEILAAKVAAARVDVLVQKQRVAVSRADRDRLRAQVEFARIRAPFNGVIVARNVDPGSFVQNATSARTQPFLSLVRIDKVTVAMQVPESAAPYVTSQTQAQISIETDAGKPIRNLRGTVTRFSPFLDADRGRTMRLEVDLYNPPERGYRRSVTRALTAMMGTLGATSPLEAGCLFHAGRSVWNRPGLLRPGMYGIMKLTLQKYSNVHLIPGGAVISQDGHTYIYIVRDGVARRVPVQVQLEDGATAKVAIIVREEDPETGQEEVLRELTGEEEIIASGQGEIADGQEVRAVRADW